MCVVFSRLEKKKGTRQTDDRFWRRRGDQTTRKRIDERKKFKNEKKMKTFRLGPETITFSHHAFLFAKESSSHHRREAEERER